MDGRVCDPDATAVNALHEPHYLPSSTGVPSVSEYFDSPSGPKHQIEKLSVAPLLTNMLGKVEGNSLILKDVKRLCQLAAANMMRRNIMFFEMAHGRHPANWIEMVNSGFMPIDAKSMNPVTGELYKGDGSPNDLLFKQARDAKGKVVGTSIWVIGPDGEILYPMSF